MKQETAILTSRLKQREPAACQQLLSDYGPAVFRIVQRIVTQHEDAEEVYQDVFVKVLQGIDSYDPDQAALGTWISRIAYHEALNSVRGRKPQMVYMEDYNTEVSYAESDSAKDEGLYLMMTNTKGERWIPDDWQKLKSQINAERVYRKK